MNRLVGFAAAWVIACMVIFSTVAVYAAQDGPSPVEPQEKRMKTTDVPFELPSLSGKVVETMNSGGYTYVSVEKNGKKTWVAIPMTAVKVGQKVTFQPGMEMRNFTSTSLKRTFASIFFSGGLAQAGSAGGDKAQHAAKTAAAPKSTGKIHVAKASGPDAYRVGEIFEKSALLNGKTAVVKAKVVKVSQGIMGKNWIHLEDGTGDAATRTNDLIATSQDLPKLGDIVTMKGTIYKDKDFGSGYKYAVIMEKASIQR